MKIIRKEDEYIVSKSQIDETIIALEDENIIVFASFLSATKIKETILILQNTLDKRFVNKKY